jgi:hypothetical protein
MATYYARSTGGNWSANTSWDSASSSGAGPAGPPVAGDTAIFDSGSTGTITLTANAACAVLNMSGAGGTLAFGTYTLTVSGDVTFGGSFTSSSVGGITINAASTIVSSSGVTFSPLLSLIGSGTKNITSNTGTFGIISIYGGAQTITLGSALTCSTLDMDGNYGNITFAGSYDISVETMRFGYMLGTSVTFVSGQTITVSTALQLFGNPDSKPTIKASTASSDTFLHYNGTAANCSVSNMNFTDVNCAHAIDNWYGGTLTRATGITNRTSADFATSSDAGNITEGTTISGIAGTYHEATEAEVQSGVQFGAGGTEYTGIYSGGSGGGGPHYGDRSGGKY